MLSVSCAILNAAGKTRATLLLMATTVVVGIGAAFRLVPAAEPGRPMLVAAAVATTMGTATGFVASVIYLRRQLGGNPPLATLLRVAAALVAVVVAGRLIPTHGKLLGLAVTVAMGVLYMGILIVTGEFGPTDRAKFARILRR
jgi:O-antigen/teichoic acid export membrane protein